ncbi:MAG: D-alanine--D-alanine ligase [Burkholderiaceae bacterium]|nr:D-alanine--D-alanine ligase [Burkholderiaceae bacterium]
METASIDPQAMGRVAVLCGGRSSEREVSILSGTGVLDALRACGVDAHAFDPSQRALDDLVREGFARAFVALHGRYGEDGTVQGALELLGIPYTGSGVMASAIAMDKVYAKRIWMTHGLRTPAFELARSAQQVRDAAKRLGLPMAVKPSREGSTIGFTKLLSLDAATAAFDAARAHDADVLCEEFVDGRELTVAVLGSGDAARALPIIEIVAPDGNYDYNNKYFSDDTRYLCPAPLDAALAASVATLSLAAYRSVACEGWGRVDVMLRRGDDAPFLLEVNTSPGMTGHSLVPMAARAVGISYEQLCLRILASASLKIGGAA